MDADYARDIRIAGIHTANVGACGRLIANRIILLEEEGVVASWIGPECGSVPSANSPALSGCSWILSYRPLYSS